jgi:hypothetical protein
MSGLTTGDWRQATRAQPDAANGTHTRVAPGHEGDREQCGSLVQLSGPERVSVRLHRSVHRIPSASSSSSSPPLSVSVS